MIAEDNFDFPTPAYAEDFGGSFAPQDGEADAGAVLNLDEVDENFRPQRYVHPKGIYDAMVSEVVLVDSKSKPGRQQLFWTIAAFGPNNKTVKVRHYTQLPYPKLDEPEKWQADMAKMKREIKAVAPHVDTSRVNPRTIGNELANRNCRVKLTIETFKGQQSNKVDFDGILPPSPQNSFA